MSATRQNPVVKSVILRAVEKRYRPIRCYKYVLDVTWSDKSRYVVYRTISEFFQLQLKLIEAFPIETGQLGKSKKTIPLVQTSSILQRDEVQRSASKRRLEIADYLKKLVNCERRILLFPDLRAFFSLRHDDLEILQQYSIKKRGMLKMLTDKLCKRKKGKKGKKGKNSNSSEKNEDLEITGPVILETYAAIADYKANGKGQISLKQGDVVDIFDKNSNGWWYVSAHGNEGWAPATYLDRVATDNQDERSESDEIPCLHGERFLTIKSYEADFNDELSFPENVVIEVLNKVLDGWWIGSYDGVVGYIPSMYLRAYKNPYLDSEIMPLTDVPATIKIQQAPRRQSIKHQPIKTQKRDFQPYRRATEKRRQRSIKQIRREKVEPQFDLGVLLEGSTSDHQSAVAELAKEQAEQRCTPPVPERILNLGDQKASGDDNVSSHKNTTRLEEDKLLQPNGESLFKSRSTLQMAGPPPPPKGNLATKLIRQDEEDYEYHLITDLNLNINPLMKPRRVEIPNTKPTDTTPSTTTQTEYKQLVWKEKNENYQRSDTVNGSPQRAKAAAPKPLPRPNFALKQFQPEPNYYDYHTIQDLHTNSPQTK